MSHPLQVTPPELALAWRRLKLDRPARSFVVHPHLSNWVDQAPGAWLDTVSKRLARGFEPTACRTCFVPKPGGLLRPASILQLEDEVVYNLLVGRLLPRIHAALADLQGDPDVANQLDRQPATPRWIRNRFESWKHFRDLSRKKLANTSYVVISDIVGFYDNIDLRRLSSDLREICGNVSDIALLMACLEKWATPREKGIPHGHSASDILAKVYCNSLDRSLQNHGLTHLRYVDDIRIFCKTKLEAKVALRTLIAVVHRRGLNLQSAKTDVKTRGEAQSLFDGITPTIEQITRDLVTEIQRELDELGPYLEPRRLAILLRESDGPPVEVIERAFSDSFQSAAEDHFEKTLFHFLLRRLATARSRVAVEYCLSCLRSRPEETAEIAAYLLAVGLKSVDRKRVIDYMKSRDAIYDYQLYQLLRMLYEEGARSKQLLTLCRKWSRDSNREPWLRTYVLVYLGRWGDPSDLETLLEKYGNLSDEVEKAEVVIALQRMERSRRNSFYGRVQGEGGLIARAVRQARSTE
jgi:hypothetical protein